MSAYFTKDNRGREILVNSIKDLDAIDRPLVLLLIAAVAGLDRTEAAIKNTWISWGEIIEAMNAYLKDFIPPSY